MFDVNSIAPGTHFMTEFNNKLAYFIQYKVNTDPLYSNVSLSFQSIKLFKHLFIIYVDQGNSEWK